MQVCAKLGSNFAEVYNADFKGEFAHADFSMSLQIEMQNSALLHRIQHCLAELCMIPNSFASTLCINAQI